MDEAVQRIPGESYESICDRLGVGTSEPRPTCNHFGTTRRRERNFIDTGCFHRYMSRCLRVLDGISKLWSPDVTWALLLGGLRRRVEDGGA